MTKVCEDEDVGLIRVKNGVVFRVRDSGLFPDVVYDEDNDHYFVNGVKEDTYVKPLDKAEMKTIFWNCNGWNVFKATDRCTSIGRMLDEENADMICLLDTRLSSREELWALGQLVTTVSRITGKTWGYRSVSKNVTSVSGGTVVLYSDAWAGVTIKEIIPYGCLLEVYGKWNGMKTRVLAVYIPCDSLGERSLRTSLQILYEGQFEKIFWEKLSDFSRLGEAMIGGDFNLCVKKIDKRILEHLGIWGKRCILDDAKGTFRR